MAGITVSDIIDPDKTMNDLSIATIGDQIDPEEFNRQPGLVYHYAVRLAEAEVQVSKLKLLRDLAEAEALEEATRELEAAGKKATVSAVAALAKSNKKLIAHESAVIKAQKVFTIIKGVKEGLSHKKDMLLMRGHMTRDELKARLSVNSDAETSIAARQDRVRDRLASIREDTSQA